MTRPCAGAAPIAPATVLTFSEAANNSGHSASPK